MDKYLSGIVAIQKRDKFSLMQYVNNELEWKQMKKFLIHTTRKSRYSEDGCPCYIFKSPRYCPC